MPRTHVVHWSDLVPKLPFASDSPTKMKRRELFDACDPRGIGLLAQAEVVRYYFRLLPPVSGVVDMKAALNACFRATREAIEPVVHIGSQQLDRNQFRVYLMSIWYYVKLWERICSLDETGERVVNLESFIKVLPSMAEWGFGVREWLSDPEPVFRRLDVHDLGEISFDALAECCLKQGLPHLSAADDEEERREALDLLGRTHPQVAAKVAPSTAGLKYRGSAPPVPPPGQKVPPPMSAPSSAGTSPRDAANSKMRRWSSQYMADFVPPSRHSSRPSSAAVSAIPTPARSRVGSRPGSRTSLVRKEALEPLSGYELRRTSSTPSVASGYSGADGHGELDRNALRSRLEQDLGMYNTCQMRKILEVAGGMVLGPKS